MRSGWVIAVAIVALIPILLMGLLWWHARPHTRYASGFSSVAFESLAIGDTETDVLRKLGPPISRRTDHAAERWCYGAWPKRSNYSAGPFTTSQSFPLVGPPCLEIGDGGQVTAAIRDDHGRYEKAVGLDRAKLRVLLGPPEHIESPDDYTELFYSALDGDDGAYENVAVILDGTGHVIDFFRDEVPD